MSDTPSGFGKFVPGFEFLQSLAGQAAGGVAQGLGQSLPQMPNLSHWVAPTFNVEDLEKRIEELKAVHFWLDQNAKALGATIQALEVQKMTLSTLQHMNFSLGDVANALKIKAADTMASFTGQSDAAAQPTSAFAGLEVPPRTYGASAAPVEPESAPEPVTPPPSGPKKKAAKDQVAVSAAPVGGVVDPMQWWGALSQQFQTIATNAMQDVATQTAMDTTRQTASDLTEQAVKTVADVAGKVTDTVARNVGMAAGVGKAAARAVSSVGKTATDDGARTASRKATAKTTASARTTPKNAKSPAKRAQKVVTKPASASPRQTTRSAASKSVAKRGAAKAKSAASRH